MSEETSPQPDAPPEAVDLSTVPTETLVETVLDRFMLQPRAACLFVAEYTDEGNKELFIRRYRGPNSQVWGMSQRAERSFRKHIKAVDDE